MRADQIGTKHTFYPGPWIAAWVTDMTEQHSKTSLDDWLRPRAARELTQAESQMLEQAIKLAQDHLDELRGLGYTGPEPSFYDPETGTFPEEREDDGSVFFRFPKLIEGGLAGSTRPSGMRSIHLSTLLWGEWPVEKIAAILAHELLHLSLGAFDESTMDDRLSVIFGVHLQE